MISSNSELGVSSPFRHLCPSAEWCRNENKTTKQFEMKRSTAMYWILLFVAFVIQIAVKRHDQEKRAAKIQELRQTIPEDIRVKREAEALKNYIQYLNSRSGDKGSATKQQQNSEINQTQQHSP